MSNAADYEYIANNSALPAGKSVFLRPIQAADEPLLQAFVRSLDPRDARFRFFAPVHELSHAAAERLTSIDFSRDMALAAFPSALAQQEMLGAAWFFADHLNCTAEFAVCVQSAHRGEGLGLLLMRELIRSAQRRGIRRLWGDVMTDNRRMLDMCAELGMVRTASPLGAGIVRLTLDLKRINHS